MYFLPLEIITLLLCKLVCWACLRLQFVLKQMNTQQNEFVALQLLCSGCVKGRDANKPEMYFIKAAFTPSIVGCWV